MAQISKKLKRQARSQYREKNRTKVTWAIKAGDLVKDKCGDVGLAVSVDNNHCYLFSSSGYRWVKMATLLKISTDV